MCCNEEIFDGQDLQRPYAMCGNLVLVLYMKLSLTRPLCLNTISIISPLLVFCNVIILSVELNALINSSNTNNTEIKLLGDTSSIFNHLHIYNRV